MTSRECNLKLINTFPELTDAYKAEISWQEGDDTGSHVIYGDVFLPFVRKAIKEQNEPILKRVFAFIEMLLSCGEPYAEEVMYFSVIESLMVDDEIQPDTFIQFAGTITLRAMQELLQADE